MTNRHTDVGERLKELRQSKSMSQDDLAEASGVSQATVSRIESNTLSPMTSTLETIVTSMGFSLGDFFRADAT